MKINIDDYFVLFSCCIPVKGYSRSIICDLQRSKFDFIPNSLFQILTENQPIMVKDCITKYSSDFSNESENNIIIEYYEFLIKNDYGFFTNSLTEIDLFPKLNLEYKNPNPITNAIIDSNENSNHDFRNIIKQLSSCVCYGIELRFYNALSIKELNNLITLFNGTTIRDVRLIVKYNTSLLEDEVKDLIINNNRLFLIMFHSAPDNRIISINNKQVLFNKSEINDESCCGVVSANYFTVRTSTFIESQKFNSCLNKKISVDKSGYIKNCPSSSNNFGNIKNVQLKDVLNNKLFTNIWEINKDQIEVCKDCEFRHICTDCRAYVADKLNIYSKPQKCNYDPYEGIWK